MVAPVNYIEPWWITVFSVKDDECRRYLQDAVMAYGIYGTIFDFSNSPDKSGCLETLFYQIKEQIDHRTEMREIKRKNGAKGGAPKGNRNAVKARPEAQRNEPEPQPQPEAQAAGQSRQVAQAQPEPAANQPDEKPQPSTGAAERPRTATEKGQKQAYSDRIESVETLLRRNFKAPEYEFDRLKGWVNEKYSGSGWDGLKPSEKRKTLSNWRPETQGERFPQRFLAVWSDVITKAKEEGADERIISAMLSDKIRFAVENDRWCVYMPKLLREWLKNNCNSYVPIMTLGGKIHTSIISL